MILSAGSGVLGFSSTSSVAGAVAHPAPGPVRVLFSRHVHKML